MTKFVFKYIISYIFFVFLFNILYYHIFLKSRIIAGLDAQIEEIYMSTDIDNTSSLDELYENEEKMRLKENLEKLREKFNESNYMLNPIHNIPFSLGAFSSFYPIYLMSLLTVYFLNMKKIREV